MTDTPPHVRDAIRDALTDLHATYSTSPRDGDYFFGILLDEVAKICTRHMMSRPPMTYT